MPFSDSGLWIPREPPKKKSWRTGFTLPVVVSIIMGIISVAFSSGLAWFGLRASRINTKLAQRAYLGYKVELPPQQSHLNEGSLEYRININNLGNTPADSIFVVPLEFDEILRQHNEKSFGRDQPQPLSKGKGALLPSDFQLGPKETVALKGSSIGPQNWQLKKITDQVFEIQNHVLPDGIHISGKITYFDVFGDFHKQYYCAWLRPEILTPPPPFATKPPLVYRFEDCAEFSREEVVPGLGLPAQPWNDESIFNELVGTGEKAPLRPRCGIEGLQDCSH